MNNPEAGSANAACPYLASVAGFLFSVLFALLCGIGSVFFSQKVFLSSPAYPDFVVGAITWSAAPKFQDIASYPAFLLGFVVGGWVSFRLFQLISIHKSKGYEQGFVTTLMWWMIPVVLGVGGGLSINPNTTSLVIPIGLAGAIATALAVRINLSREKVEPQLLGLGILATMLAGLIPFAFAAIQDRVPFVGELLRLQLAPKVALLLFVVATTWFLYLCSGTAFRLSKYIRSLLVLSQCCIACFYLLILPDMYLADTGKPAIPSTLWLWLLSSGLAFVGAVDVVARYVKCSRSGYAEVAELISPIALFGSIIFFKSAQTVMPQIPADDYHFGEGLLGWWSFLEYGKIPYVDFISPHGIFGDDFGGYLSAIFYDKTAATLSEANRLASTLAMLAAFMAIRLCTASIALAYVSILLVGTMPGQLFFLAIGCVFCLWFRFPVHVKPKLWLWTWLLGALLLVLAVPPQGLLAVAASSPAVLLYLYRARQANWKRDAWLFAVLVGLLGAFTNIPSMLYGAVRYVLENGPINHIAYGIPWSWSWAHYVQDKSKLLLEVFRMAWVWVPLSALLLVVGLCRQKSYRAYLIGVAVPVFLFASLMAPYSMGRIDPAAISRPGLLTNFAWTILLPILLSPLLGARGKAALAMSVTFVCAGLGLVSVNMGGFSDVLVRNQVGPLWVGVDHGLKNLGAGLVDLQHVDRLTRINNVLNKHLAPHEGYLDLTGRNAHYMYFNRPPLIAITAPYNLAPIQQQRRAVGQLANFLPRLALLEADNINQDGGSMALRTHLMYRFVLKHYDAELHDGYVFGFSREERSAHAAMTFVVKDISDPNWERGINRARAGLVIRDSVVVRFLNAGDSLRLPDNQIRKIAHVSPGDNVIWLEGSPLTPEAFDNSRDVQVEFDEQHRRTVSAKLMESVFAVPDLREIPVSWGRSASSLSTAMKYVADVDVARGGLHDITREGGTVRVVGSDPYLWFDIAELNLSGESAGLLQFDFACTGSVNPRIEIIWWGNDASGSEQTGSLKFTSAKGRMIIPLDAYPAWLMLAHVKGLRVDLETVGGCETFSVKNISLYQRAHL